MSFSTFYWFPWFFLSGFPIGKMTPLWWSKADDDPGRGGDAVASGFKEPEGHGSEEPQGHDSTEPQGHDSTEPQGHEAEDPAMSPVFAVSCFEVKPRCFLICQTELMLGGVSHTCCRLDNVCAVAQRQLFRFQKKFKTKLRSKRTNLGENFSKRRGAKHYLELFWFSLSLKDLSLLGKRITNDMSPGTKKKITDFRENRKRSQSRNWHTKFESKGVTSFRSYGVSTFLFGFIEGDKKIIGNTILWRW